MSLMRPDNEQDWPSTLAISRAPEVVLNEAREAATALKRVIDGKAKKVTFGGEPYLEFEDWLTVGRFYGIAPRVTDTKYVEYGGVTGWEASADAVHVESGKIVSSADSMCLTDEANWSTRTRTAWHYVMRSGGVSAEDPGRDELVWERDADGRNRPKKVRVETAEPVPMFQLRSMAQTRACAKALRNSLAWVVVLAGYRPTPAEEMDGPRDSTPLGTIREDVPSPPAPEPERTTGYRPAQPEREPGEDDPPERSEPGDLRQRRTVRR